MATAAIKAQLAGKAANGVGDDVMPLGQQFDGNTVPTVNIPLQQRMHDELWSSLDACNIVQEYIYYKLMLLPRNALYITTCFMDNWN